MAYRLVDEYDRLKPLEDDDIDMLVTLLSFPEKFWKIINQYYNAGKAWVPAKNIDKLKIVIEKNNCSVYAYGVNCKSDSMHIFQK